MNKRIGQLVVVVPPLIVGRRIMRAGYGGPCRIIPGSPLMCSPGGITPGPGAFFRAVPLPLRCIHHGAGVQGGLLRKQAP